MDVPSPERTEMLLALSQWRDSAFADLIVVAMGLAALERPQELRKALGSVFDLSAVEKTTDRIAATVEHACHQAEEARHLLEELHRVLERIEKRLDGVEEFLERSGRRMAQLAKRLNQLEGTP